jgi:hypothetical protein
MTTITLEVPRVVTPVHEDCYTAGQIVVFYKRRCGVAGRR